MKIIGVVNQKGGTGKTTISTCLAVAFSKQGLKTTIFDLDPQATACFWSDTRKLRDISVVSVQPVRMRHMINTECDSGTNIVIIDGAAIQREIAYDVAQVADFVLIPTKPAVFDITSMQETIKALKYHRTNFSILLNMISPNGKEEIDVYDVAKVLEAKISDISIGNRKDFFRAQSVGLAVQEYNPEGKAALEILQLFEFVINNLKN